MTAKLNLKIIQGSTFSQVLQWETSEKVYVPITTITKQAPVSITAPQHNIPNNWRARITNVTGMKEIDSSNTGEYYKVTVVDADTITINSINSIGYQNYTSGGILEYNKPADLQGMTARMQIRAKIDSDVVILELSTANGGIVINNQQKTISINIQQEQTQLLNFAQAVYDLEVTSSGGITTQFIQGSISLVKEVTR